MRKKLLLVLAVAMLGGCSGYQGGNLMQHAARDMLIHQCHDNINRQPLWQSAKMVLGAEAQRWENRICQCAAEEAAQQMGMQQIVQFSSGQTDQALVNLTAQAAVNCYQRFAAHGFR
ncbi:MAG: hypothetical protein Q4A06_08550 [Cardiobacteriaceae bacterium]|nr:hypothetical protein [Cardiobacteriaceae bacterium]